MDGSSLVSIIVPCFNAGPMLRPALQSLIDQTHPDIEIIFVDNNSTDGSGEVARTLAGQASRPFRFASCAPKGAAQARNLGYTLAQGGFIQWMDADDRLEPDKISRQVAALSDNPGDEIAYGDWTAHRFAPPGPPLPTAYDLTQVDDQVTRTLAGVWYPPTLYLIRRAAADRLQAAEGWPTDRPVVDDIEYSAVAALLGLRFRHVAGARTHYNVWSDQQISNLTPYADRVAMLASTYNRLATFSRSAACAVSLTPAQRVLLAMDWTIRALPTGAAGLTRLSESRFRFSRVDSAASVELGAREAVVAAAMMRDPRPLAAGHRALQMEAQIPALKGDHAFIVATLAKFVHAGVFI